MKGGKGRRLAVPRGDEIDTGDLDWEWRSIATLLATFFVECELDRIREYGIGPNSHYRILNRPAINPW